MHVLGHTVRWNMLGSILKKLLASVGSAKPGLTAFEAGIAAYADSDYAAAGRHFDDAIAAGPRRADALYYASLVAYKTGLYARALDLIERACALDPENGEYRYQTGAVHWMLGDGAAARACCEQALRLAPEFALAYSLMAQIALPGPSYVDLLPSIHAQLQPRTYIEIGVFTGNSIALARPETRAIGIDPKPRIGVPLGARTTIHASTSDEYFSTHDVKSELDGLPLDLAFIDGMHHFDFALRDFIQIEKLCTPQSTVLIHDCYPFDRRTAERERHTAFWSGDIWGLVLLLKKYRPELRIHTIATAPTGLGVVRGLDPSSRVLERNFEAVVAEFMALDYAVLDDDKAGMLNLYPNDWEKILPLLQ
ncbi:MAG: class I SAM-dependent methyltransferase [Pseudomonadota bacterium]